VGSQQASTKSGSIASIHKAISSLSAEVHAARSELRDLKSKWADYNGDNDDWDHSYRRPTVPTVDDRSDYSMADYDQDEQIRYIERIIRQVAKQIRRQQEQLLDIARELQASKTYSGFPGSSPTPPPSTYVPYPPVTGIPARNCRNWVAVEHLKPPVHSHAVPFYVSGDVETEYGAESPRLQIARFQESDPKVLVLDLIEFSGTPDAKDDTQYRTVQFSNSIKRGQYKRVQINRDGNKIALIDVEEVDKDLNAGLINPNPNPKPRLFLSDGEDLKRGSRNPRVRTMQQMFEALGYNITIDGDFGPETEKVVMDFQDIEELKEDGVMASTTRRHLNQAVRWWQPKRKPGTKTNGWRSIFN
jgi:hypothetical protein